MAFYDDFLFNEALTFWLLVISGIISLFFFLNSADFFVKLNINNARLAVSRENVFIQLGPSLFLLLAAWINTSFNSSVEIRPLHSISTFLFILALFWRYFGFTGIFRPVNEPFFLNPKEAEERIGDYLANDMVVGLIYNNEARVYPIQPLQITHVVNDKIQDFYVAIAFCGLCNLAIAFNRFIDGEPRNIRAVYAGRSNLVVTDDNGNYWQQLTGQGVHGKYAIDNPLVIYDTLVTSWKSWQHKHPSTKVLGNRLQGRVKFGFKWFKKLLYLARNTDTVLFPAGDKNEKFGPKEKLLGVIVNGKQIAIPVELFNTNIEINTELSDIPLFIYFDRKTETYGAFERKTGMKLALSTLEDKLLIVSEDRGNQWSSDGEIIQGDEKLIPIKKMYPAFWFVWIGHYPDSIIISP